MMLADQFAGPLNAYESAHADEPWAADPWGDVLAAQAGARWDKAATAAPDGSYVCTVVVFTDGSALVRRADTRRWVALWPSPVTRT